MYINIVPLTDQHGRLAGHGRVNGLLTEKGAVYAVARIGRSAANKVTRVYVFQINFNIFFSKMGVDFIGQKNSDITQANVA